MLKIERAGTGVPLVLVHGFLGSASMWAPLLAYFQRSFDVIAVDLPGFGQEAERTAPSRIDHFAHSVVDTIDALGLGCFNLIGHSMGGMIAQQVALDCHKRVNRLVLYGTAACGALPHRFEPIATTIAELRNNGVDTIGRQIVRSWFIAGDADPSFASCVAAIRNVTLDTAIAALSAIANWDIRARLTELTMPCLVIGGDTDRSTPPDELFALRARLRGADLCVLPGTAHAAHLERSDLFNGVVGQFLKTGSAAFELLNRPSGTKEES